MTGWRCIIACMIVSWPVAVASADTVLYDFEAGSQGWSAFGPILTDSGLDPAGAFGQGRFQTGDFDLPGFGMLATSPFVDMSSFTGLRVFARLRDVPGFPVFTGTPTMRMGLGIGSAEWLADVVITNSFAAYEADFASLVPDGVFATAPITPAELADPALEIKFVIINAANTGTGEFNYDHVTGIGPGGQSQVPPGTIIYDFEAIPNTCYPDDWTFFGISQTDFGLDLDAEDGFGAFQAAGWDICDLNNGPGVPGCQWAGSAIGVGPFNHIQCTPGGVSDANLDLSLGTGFTIRIKNLLTQGLGGTLGARAQLQMTDADGTNAVLTRSALTNPAVNRAQPVIDLWQTYTFFFKGLDSSFDNDDAVSGTVPGLDLTHITTIKIIWRRESASGTNVFEFDEITLINTPPILWPDRDGDGDVDMADYAEHQTCFTQGLVPPCDELDADYNGLLDMDDFEVWKDGMQGPDVTDAVAPFFPWCY